MIKLLYILQSQNDEKAMTVDYAILKELLEHSHFQHIEMSLRDFYNGDTLKTKGEFDTSIHNAIPLGTIQFVTAYLNIFYGIEKMNPIEIPKVLRTDEFLKRKYEICYGKNLPKKGRYFVKNVSTLKTMTFSGHIEDVCNKPDFLTGKKPFEDDELYQLSDIVNIKSEYRVYIISGKIYAIAYYDGDATIFPDVSLIQKANLIYSVQKDYPNSYTMDIAVSDKGTILLECHPLFSCGIYQTVLGTDFLYGYRDSMDYLKKYNTKLTVDK